MPSPFPVRLTSRLANLPASCGRAAGRRRCERADDGHRAAPRGALFAHGHKVLIFLQFITMLDLIEVVIQVLIPTPLYLLTVTCGSRTGRASSSTGHCAA